jgi:transposase
MHPGCAIEQVYLYREPIDFRKAINALSVLVERELGLNPFASALYVSERVNDFASPLNIYLLSRV